MANSPLQPIKTSGAGFTPNRVAQLEGGVGNNQQARASDVNPIIDYLNARSGDNATSSSQTGTTATINSPTGSLTFTSQSIAADASASYTITDSYSTTNSVPHVVVTAATAGALPVVSKVVPSNGSFVVTIVNETGATTYTSVSFKFILF